MEHDDDEVVADGGVHTLLLKKPKPWVMQITNEGKIVFNREAYPDFAPDDFAKEVVSCLEAMVVKKGLEE